ncbi:MAG: TolC family protein [Sphingobacteriaceae bacterium]
MNIHLKFKSLVIAFLLLFSAAGTKAQTVNLTLRDALNYALQNNENIKKAKLEILNGEYKTDEIRARALPQLNGTATLTDQLIIPQLVVGDQVFKMGRQWNGNAGVQFSQQLFNQQVFTGLKAAKAGESFYNLSAELTEENILQQVATAYYQLLVTREQLKTIDANISSISKIETTVANQFKNGLAKRIDLDRVRVNLTNVKTQREQVANAITQQENVLKFYIGMPVETEVVIPATELNKINTDAQTLSDSFNVGELTQYQLLAKQKELLEYQKKAAKAEYYPSLSLTGNYGYTSTSDKFDILKGGNSTATKYDASAIGLSLNIPIFDGNARKSRVKQAEIEIQQIEEDIKNTTNSLNLAHKNANLSIRNNINTINSQRENVVLAKQVYSSTQNNYNNGLATLTDLLNAETSLVDAQNSYNQALLNYKLAEIQLIQSNGNIKSLLN